jgi:hypothetical protein
MLTRQTNNYCHFVTYIVSTGAFVPSVTVQYQRTHQSRSQQNLVHYLVDETSLVNVCSRDNSLWYNTSSMCIVFVIRRTHKDKVEDKDFVASDGQQTRQFPTLREAEDVIELNQAESVHYKRR